MKKIKFLTGEYFHIYNREVEKRKIFLDEADYFRFLLGLREFNHTKQVYNLHRLHKRTNISYSNSKKPLVEIVCYTLMPNHYHLILRQIKDGGISKFMQKLGTGYTKYFNKRYGRTGVLFQGIFKVKHITNDAYIIHLSRYIHLNALDLIKSDWIKKSIKKDHKTYEFLKEYKWHSLPFWTDNKPCLIKLNPKIVLGQFDSKKDYEEFLKDWKEDTIKKIKEVVIEELK